jgi:hypothetical protein
LLKLLVQNAILAHSPGWRNGIRGVIEKCYAAHINTDLAAAAINIMRFKPKKKKKTSWRSDAAQPKSQTEV